MSKQDGSSPRTAVDLERKYNFGKSFAEVYGLVSDAQKAAQEAQNAFDGLNQAQIFNLLTNYGKAQGIYRDDNGDVYVNASYIKSGKLAAEYIDATDLQVNAANITGTLKVGQMPTGIAMLNDIPKDYVTESNITTIINGIVTTDYLYALGVSATELRGTTVGLYTGMGAAAGGLEITGASSWHFRYRIILHYNIQQLNTHLKIADGMFYTNVRYRCSFKAMHHTLKFETLQFQKIPEVEIFIIAKQLFVLLKLFILLFHSSYSFLILVYL